ncbi:MAG: patatin-like phospholipase family protein [Clostridiales bacterium]|nr:patatin-like phospholipase family protein [Clostridiales bacterium]
MPKNIFAKAKSKQEPAKPRPRVGLALGAGGGRGLAHIGILQALEAHNIPIDLIAGCSIGSIVGAVYAAGTDLRMLELYCGTLAGKDILDVALPHMGGLLRGDKLEEIVRVLTHDLSFGETRIPFFCTAVDLASGKLEVLQQGKIHRAVRASIAIPGVFTPVRMDNKVYADGGILEEMPVDLLRVHGADIVIASDLSLRRGITEADRLSPVKTLMRAVDIMQLEMTRLLDQKIDVRIVPDASFMGTVSTVGAAESIQEGRRATEELMPRILELVGGLDRQ